MVQVITWLPFATSLLSAFALQAPVPGEAGTAASAINNWGSIAAGGFGDGSNATVKTFINILVFDKDYKFLDLSYAPVTSGGAPVYISAEYTIKEAGYVYMYVSNENQVPVNVYFDDVKMTYTPTNVIQYNEYYPFGLQTSTRLDKEQCKRKSVLV